MGKCKKGVHYMLQLLLGMGIALFLGNSIYPVQAKAEQLIICEADGNDGEDDTAAIQASLDAAKGTGGATVQIPAGKYYISKTLVIYSDTTLLLAPDTEIIRTDGSNIMIRSEQNYEIGGYGQASNILIDGGVWNGNVTDTTVLCPLMYFCHAQNIGLQNFSVKSACSRHMIILAGIDTATVSNISFSDFVLFTGEDVNGEYYTPDSVTGEVSVELSMRTMEALHLDCVSADGISESLAYPCDDTANRNIVVENCTFNGLMSGVGSHYYANPALKGTGLTIRDNNFINMRYTCIDIYNQDGISVTGNNAENVGELLRAVSGSGTISGNTVVCAQTAEESELGLCGIKITDSRNMQLDHNTITGGAHGISASNMSGGINDNTITGSLGNGISLLDGSETTVAANSINAAAGSGIYAENASGSASGNEINNSGMHGAAFYSANFSVEGNTIQSPQGYGVCVNGSTAIVTENTIRDAGSHGLFALERSELTAEKNHIYNAAENGIFLNGANGQISSNEIIGGENGCLFSGASGEAVSNTISNTRARGIWMLSGSVITAAENTITEAGSHGIHMNGAAGELRGNKVTGSVEKGIYLYAVTGTDAGKVNVTGNEVQGSKDRGIQLEASSYVTVDNNKVNGSGQQGIRLISECSNVSVTGNTVTQNKQHGIIVEKSKEITIDNNTVTGNVNKEISVLNESTGSAAHNIVDELGVYTYDNARFPISADNGLVKIQNQWLYMKNGAIDKNFEGMVKNAYGWWYVKNGTIDWTYTGMAKNEYGWWYITKGQLDSKYTGMAKNEYGWWYMKNGKLDTTFTGIAQNQYGQWYMVKGKLNTGVTGTVKTSQGTCYVVKGKLDTSRSGMTKGTDSWYYLKSGWVDTAYTGMARNDYGWWYIKNGRLDQTYTGMAKNDYGWWYMKNGKLDQTYTGMAKNNYGWWYMKNGKLDTTYTGVAQNDYGWWYMKNGQLQANFSGSVKINGITYTVSMGKVTGSYK